jgi:hypothetical protein
MKKSINFFLILFLNILICSQSSSQSIFYNKKYKQKTDFQRDENNKIVFYEVVSLDSIEGIDRKILYENALNWLRTVTIEKSDKITFENELMGIMEAETGFMVYIPSMITKIPHGKIFYKIQIEVKEKKYRYYFYDFVFQYYKQDRRDLKYKPVSKSIRPLEKEKYPGYQTAWNAHKVTLKERIEGQIEMLKNEIKVVNKKESNSKPEKVIKKTDW